ncbi:MAG TPA: Ig-like domain-containing protein [Kofleriaceae bacterium]|nr:Ig-like domain-containing protein [Kofleriaceae bacterium]
MSILRLSPVVLVAAIACGDNETGPLQTAAPGVVFAFPVDGQLDVPTGARVVVTFSDEVRESALGECDAGGGGGFCLVGPDGPVAVTPMIVGERRTVEIPSGQLAPGTTYELHVGSGLAPFAQNLPAEGPLLRFTTRSNRPRAAPPSVIAVNGTDPARLGEPGARPFFESSTIRVVLSEPLDPATVAAAPGSVELVAGTTAVPATVIAQGIHVAIDPHEDLAPGTTYELRLGGQIRDLGGQALAPVTFSLAPQRTAPAEGPIRQVLRTRQAGDPGPERSRAGAEPNVIELIKPLIGREEVMLERSVLGAELGDPEALGGPIAFTIRRGQRLRASGIDVKLGGEIPVGLSTGELQIELLTDAGGRIYRNPNQPAEQIPENERAPAYVDLSMDVAVFATDPTGTAVLSQTILGLQASGTAVPTEGVLAIEAVASMELGLLGVTSAPSNLVLELITSPGDAPPIDAEPPSLVTTYPAAGTAELPVDAGIELVFDEPVDLDRLRAGGVRLETAGGAVVPAAIESHGAAVVIRPRAPLAYSTSYRVALPDVADVAGNRLADAATLQFSTPQLVATSVPITVAAMSPGVPCALVAPSATSPGRCAGGLPADDMYRPFTLEQDRAIEVDFTGPVRRTSAVLGTSCGTGSVRVEALSAGGGCTGTVPGTLLVHDRSLSFIPDQPWAVGARYRFALASGSDGSCGAGELCGANGVAASFDPLAGAESGDGGGPSLVIDFTAVAPSGATAVFARTEPRTDINGSGFVEAAEVRRDENRAALRITGTSGAIASAKFTTEDCLSSTPEVESCMYLSGALPVALGELTTSCPLPDGSSAPSCLPVEITPQAMYATAVSMEANITIATIPAETGTTVMRLREPASGPITGYIIDGGGTPKMVVALDLYMDAPDMELTATTHDLHSKPLSVTLEGPVEFLPDGRIAIRVSNVADLPVEVSIEAPFNITGSIQMAVPAGEMKLQLVSAPLRGGAR